MAESPYASPRAGQARHLTWYTVPAFPFLTSIEAINRSDAGYRMSDLELGAALRDADCTLPFAPPVHNGRIYSARVDAGGL